MGSYNRITIALFLLVFLVSVGRGVTRGDGLTQEPIASSSNTLPPVPATSAASTPSASTPTPSTPPEDTSTELYTETVTTVITEESSKATPTQQTLTSSRSAPDSTNGITQNVIGTMVSSKAGLEVTTVHSSVTQDIGNGTGVNVSTDGEGFTTREVDVDVTSDGVDTTTGSLSEDLSKEGTTVGSEEPTNRLTVITNNIIPTTDEWPTALQDGDVLPSTSEYTDTTNTPIQEITGKVTTAADSEMLTSALTTALGEQSTTHFASTSETLTTSDRSTTATLTTSEGQTTSSLPPETAEKATTAPFQTSPLTTSERSTTSVLLTSLPPATSERTTTAPFQTSPPTTSKRATTSVLHTSLPSNCKDLPFPCSTTTSTPTASTPTTSTLTTSEGETTSVLHTSLPPTTPERVTTALLQTSPLTTSKRATTSVLHTSLPSNCKDLPFPCSNTSTPTASTPTTSTLTTSKRATTSVLHTSPPSAERTTTAQQPTTASRASTASPSTTHVAQTTAHDEIQEPRGDDSMNQISWTDLAEEERENILSLSFNDITVEDWMKHYDLIFRQFLSNKLTSNTLRVEPENIYYIEPTPLLRRNVLYLSIFARYSSMKRSALPFVPLNETMAALSNLTALADALGLKEPPTIIEGVPDFILPITQPPTTQPSTTRKPPPKIGFLSNPGLFISLVVIATVSIIIIIVGLIYLLCDRRRGRTGEYITNHTPRNSDLELGLDNPVMAENDKNVSNGNHLSSIKGDMESDMIVPYDNFTQEELMNYEVEDTHL